MSCWANDDTTRHEILRLLAYRREEFDRSVLPFAYQGNLTTVTRIVRLSHYSSLSVFGDLEVLPVEMLNATLGNCDLRTLSILRQVNRRARILVDAFLPYKHISTHASHVLDVFTRTGVASHFTVVEVFKVMCSSSCAICGRFGGFLWIPDCIRCCIPCLRESPELLPMTVRDAQAAFGLSPKMLGKIPIVDTLPGTYNLQSSPYKKKRRLLSEARAKQAAVIVHGGEEGLAAYIKLDSSQAKAAYDKRVARLNATREAFDSQGRLNNFVDDIRRFQVTTRLPYFNLSLHSTRDGVSCRGCRVAAESENRSKQAETVYVLWDRREQTFTEEMFLEHFDNCANAQRIWAEHQRSNGMA